MWLFPLLLLLLLLPNVACATAPGPAGATAALMLTAGTNFSLGTSPTDVTTYWANGPPRQYSNFGSSLYNPTVGHIQTSTSGVALVSAGFVFQNGQRFEIAANVNTPDQATLALDLGAESVGLMRTEFLFLERSVAPTEDEQTVTGRMLDALGGRPLIVRALDIGGDKQVAHLDLPHEANPFLGVRGARLLLRRPDLMEPQLRALYRAAKRGGSCRSCFR